MIKLYQLLVPTYVSRNILYKWTYTADFFLAYFIKAKESSYTKFQLQTSIPEIVKISGELEFSKVMIITRDQNGQEYSEWLNRIDQSHSKVISSFNDL